MVVGAIIVVTLAVFITVLVIIRKTKKAHAEKNTKYIPISKENLSSKDGEEEE